MSGIAFDMGSNAIYVSLAGILVSLVCLCTELYLLQKHLQYKPIDRDITPNAETEVPLVESIFTFIEGQELWGYVLSFVRVLFMLIINTCLISGILWAKSWNLSSLGLDMFKDCIMLKLSIYK